MPLTRRSLLLSSLPAPLLLAEKHADPTHAFKMPSSEEVLRELQNGNKRFAAGKPHRPHSSKSRMRETAVHGQHPYAICLACADSRVPVEELFDQGVGDVFTVRVAGNVANNDEIASVEYAVDHLGSPVCVVLGHTACGAVSAVVNGEKVPPSIERLVVHINEAVERTRKASPELKGEELIAEAVRVNVWESVEDLIRGSQIIAAKVHSGALQVVGAVYHLDDGKVEWLGSYPKALSVLR